MDQLKKTTHMYDPEALYIKGLF